MDARVRGEVVSFACVESERKKKLSIDLSWNAQGKWLRDLSCLPCEVVLDRDMCWWCDVCLSRNGKVHVKVVTACDLLWSWHWPRSLYFSVHWLLINKMAHSYLVGCCCAVLVYRFGECTRVPHTIAILASVIATVASGKLNGLIFQCELITSWTGGLARCGYRLACTPLTMSWITQIMNNCELETALCLVLFIGFASTNCWAWESS